MVMFVLRSGLVSPKGHCCNGHGQYWMPQREHDHDEHPNGTRLLCPRWWRRHGSCVQQQWSGLRWWWWWCLLFAFKGAGSKVTASSNVGHSHRSLSRQVTSCSLSNNTENIMSSVRVLIKSLQWSGSNVPFRWTNMIGLMVQPRWLIFLIGQGSTPPRYWRSLHIQQLQSNAWRESSKKTYGYLIAIQAWAQVDLHSINNTIIWHVRNSVVPNNLHTNKRSDLLLT